MDNDIHFLARLQCFVGAFFKINSPLIPSIFVEDKNLFCKEYSRQES